MSIPKKIKSSHVRQQDRSDCGVACLLAALRYFGGDHSLERLRELSGTGRQGTTLMGLHQAAGQLGIESRGYTADLDNLKACSDIAILHVLRENRFHHFVVYYGCREDGKFLISDPGDPGPVLIAPDELDRIWRSRALLLLKPGEGIMPAGAIRSRKWAWFRSVLREDLDIIWITVGMGIFVAVLGLTTAIFTQKLVDNILPARDELRLVLATGALLFLLLARGGLNYLRGRFLLRQARDFNVRLIDTFYGRLLRLPKSFFDHRSTGDLVARMNDTQRIQRTVSFLATGIVIDMLMIFVAMAAIVFYDWGIALGALAYLPVFVLISYVYNDRILQGQRQAMMAYARNESNYIDTITGVGAIKVLNKQRSFTSATRLIYDRYQQAVLSLGHAGLSFNLATEGMIAVFLIGIISWSSWYALQDLLSTGAMLAIFQMSILMAASARHLSASLIQLQEARVAFDRMYEFVSIDDENPPGGAACGIAGNDINTVEVSQLSFSFPGRQTLLRDISIAVNKGEWVAILGESGCGKSTLLQILQKFYRPDAGLILVDGVDYNEWNVDQWRACLGVVPQQVKIFNGSLLFNIVLEERVDEPGKLFHLLDSFGFTSFFSQFPHGYETVVGEEGVNLSGGQQQLVGLARALYRQPQVLLLDEPTAALDRNTEQFVLDLISRIRENMMVVTLTHRIEVARRADRMYIIENGLISSRGVHTELLLTDNLYSRAWRDLVGS